MNALIFAIGFLIWVVGLAFGYMLGYRNAKFNTIRCIGQLLKEKQKAQDQKGGSS